jgi:hypothetical protein
MGLSSCSRQIESVRRVYAFDATVCHHHTQIARDALAKLDAEHSP